MKTRTLAYIGFFMMISGYVFAIAETVYFGCNWHPQSRKELIADSIALIVSGSGCTILITCIFTELMRRVNELFKDL